MKQFNASNLIVRPQEQTQGVLMNITPESAGWEHIHFQARRMRTGERREHETGESELAIVVLSGRLSVQSSRGEWHGIGERASVFAGFPHALYLPRHTTFTIVCESRADYVITWTHTDRDYAPRHVTPADVKVEIRGGDNATRQINSILPPGFPCHKLVIVEVYTPAGSWSSYPPHKHDVHKVDASGAVLEADLEEVYYYKLDRPDGFALQRVYTAPESPLHAAGFPIDATLVARDGDAVLVPEGYHPVTAAPGYNAYYLNVLAGSAQSLANSDDPAHSWVKHAYKGTDPRVPFYK
jgi:5-deoxy-glucuronate isomerase